MGTLTDETFSHICCQITAELDSIKSCCTEERVRALGEENLIEFINDELTLDWHLFLCASNCFNAQVMQKCENGAKTGPNGQ